LIAAGWIATRRSKICGWVEGDTKREAALRLCAVRLKRDGSPRMGRNPRGWGMGWNEAGIQNTLLQLICVRNRPPPAHNHLL